MCFLAGLCREVLLSTSSPWLTSFISQICSHPLWKPEHLLLSRALCGAARSRSAFCSLRNVFQREKQKRSVKNGPRTDEVVWSSQHQGGVGLQQKRSGAVKLLQSVGFIVFCFLFSSNLKVCAKPLDQFHEDNKCSRFWGFLLFSSLSWSVSDQAGYSF